ncbi:ABC transporter ATP-binding protein [Glycomyces harbinensis]|uniref:Branched-chain amino acid transport system ATP-binding protein n=1 Tax=Glycomyces harbinensis TaxID=58114 RepID=A0A1G6WUL9_9ACTN|nr:ABC transporter ATP-binding protein [Glycomyces harbinensis]SDD69592.1 branched-chain amino acid transport system ATP-binding protein [Glycomyces harbinensis]
MTTSPLLEVRGLRAGYGASIVLEDLGFRMGVEAVGIVGRNGMGKSTLCDALVGFLPPSGGRVLLRGNRIDGRSPERIARSGIAYVPQGRRLFLSLTVEEHLAMLSRRGRRWTPSAVYALFPRLAERKRQRGGNLSGGEQQMLAVGRALLLDADLIVMDEPSEGLAPAIVDVLVDTVHHLVAEGVAVLVVEQNLRAAVRMAPRQLVMVSGRIEAEFAGDELLDRPDLQHRYLGVGTATAPSDPDGAGTTDA